MAALTLRDQLRAAGLRYADIERLSDGKVTDSKLRKAQAGIRDLTAEDQQLVSQIVAQYRMANERVKVVITSFPGVGRQRG